MPVRSLPAAPRWLLPGLLLPCLLLAACGKHAPAEGQNAADHPVAVTTAVLAPRPFNDALQALGTAQARESVTITAKVSDVITRLAFDSGQRVRAGQLLADMNSRAQQADVAAAEAALRDAEQQLRRGGELASAQLIARGQYDTLRANRDAAAASVQARRASVADRTITAPFAGVLGLRQVSLGALVAPGTVITTLDDDSTIKLDFTLPEAALSSIARGQAISATSDAWPGVAFDGHIADIDSRVDPETRAVRVRAELPNSDGRLRQGMLLRVQVQLPTRQALVLPELAVQQEAEQSSVFRVGADGKVEQVPVKLGTRREGVVEVVSGLKAGDRIVVEGTVKLHPGSRVVEAAKTASAPPPTAASATTTPVSTAPR
ncbi:MAG TPA: efflux RND transporter periplasmic adaptor subunit [Luteimonas sp.]|nr:efflux RND transporter periplasmic adaptor subunit [Luteimonas sp.]